MSRGEALRVANDARLNHEPDSRPAPEAEREIIDKNLLDKARRAHSHLSALV